MKSRRPGDYTEISRNDSETTIADRHSNKAYTMELLSEIWMFMRVRKKFWLAPIIISLLLLGLLFFFAGQAGVVSPFIYML